MSDSAECRLSRREEGARLAAVIAKGCRQSLIAGLVGATFAAAYSHRWANLSKAVRGMA